MSIIHKTKNYSQFKSYQSNRPIEISQLLKSVKRKNLLSTHAIIVNEDLFIIDGQHRLAVAKELNTEIYYVIGSGLGEEDIALCQVSKNWSIENYLNYFNDKISDYKFLAEMYNKYNIPLSNLITHYCNKQQIHRLFKEGLFHLSYDKLFLERKTKEFFECKKLIKSFIKKRLHINALNAIWQIVLDKNYEHEKFLYKINKYPSNIIKALKFFVAADIKGILINEVYNRTDLVVITLN